MDFLKFTHMHTFGGVAEVSMPHDECFLALPTLCSTYISPVNATLPNPKSLDGYII